LTSSIYFETSNCCELTARHQLCPLAKVGHPPQHLPIELVAWALEALARYRYRGEVRFHTMSEPLIDPRLFELLRLTREACPGSPITLWTNGQFLSDVLAHELVDAGVTTLLTTAYSRAEQKRLAALRVKVRHRVHFCTGLDESLLAQYDVDEVGSTEPCSAPLNKLSIGRDGSLMLCCRDWRKRHTFGNLKDRPLDELVAQREVWQRYCELREGRRDLHLCRRCTRSR
jgi:MoaA/NifB/PqqE/SkfB family radical SAM enzyme